MPAKKFKCTKCSRRFGMAAHLARHMGTIHAAPGTRRPKTSATGRGPGRPRLSAGGSLVDGASRFLAEMHDYHQNLLTQRDAIESQISAMATAIGAMGGATAKRGPGRPKGSGRGPRPNRAGSLKDMIVKVLGQRVTPLSPNEISTAVVKAGYASKAKDLTKAVSNVLPEIKTVKRLGFGKYTTK